MSSQPLENSRRKVLKSLFFLSFSAALQACQEASESQTSLSPTASPILKPIESPTPPPLPTSTSFPTLTPIPTFESLPTPSPEDPSPHDLLHQLYTRLILEQIEAQQPHQLTLLLRPLDQPSHQIAHLETQLQPSASVIKAVILYYALSRQPQLPLTPPAPHQRASDLYRMVVTSHNTATARILAQVASSPDQALNEFNLYLHQVLNWPSDQGLTHWGYRPLLGVTTNQVFGQASFDNPISLSSLVDFFTLLENTQSLLSARCQTLLSIPDPDYQTTLDLALLRAMKRHPDLHFSYYGKNGTISPPDWAPDSWYINEAAIINVTSPSTSRSFAFAFSAKSFETQTFFDLLLDYLAHYTNL